MNPRQATELRWRFAVGGSDFAQQPWRVYEPVPVKTGGLIFPHSSPFRLLRVSIFVIS